ncbi:S-layer homology domain-containing protein [Paenibacillus sp. YYML68]|uniref:S-layer homology domain-containing protein n=1 Tax=Paenibacillus sp. YYML68 TaxID=2909250 RepID=UPI0024902923|nr:S-layer homology domain-containing protein [Paenibacillus sp. YYML68]
MQLRNRQMNKSRKLAAAVLALSLAFSGSAYAADPVSVTANTNTSSVLQFSDVSGTHWAVKHVTKLAALGIVQGYENREYRPDTTVSQQEVIIMAIRMMGLEQQALSDTAETVLPVLVSDYAKPYVAYALDKGLLLASEELANTTTTKTAWGSREASREWVAKLVIRAIGKEQLAKDHSASTVPFTDATSFSTAGKGYVNAAVLLGIVQGFEDGSFKPQGSVTRAQMATFLSRADKEMTVKSSRVATGYIMDMMDGKLTVLNSKGDTNTYTMNADTVIYNAKDDTRIPATQLKLTNEIYMVQSLNKALYIELTNADDRMEVTEAILDRFYMDRMIVSAEINGSIGLFDLAANVSVTDKDGRGLSIGSVQAGSLLELKRNTLLKENKITHIVVKQAPVSKTAEGTISSIDRTQGSITILEKTSVAAESYAMTEPLIVKLPDGSLADLSKLHLGDAVTYEVKNNKLVGITIKKQADVVTTVQGTLTAEVNKDTRILTITKTGGSGLAAYYLNDNAIVDISGLSSASLFDLEVGDELSLELLNDKVVKVSVTSRQVESFEFVKILSFEPTTKVLTIIKNNGSFGAYQLSDTTVIKFAGTTLPIDQFQTNFIGTQSGQSTADRNRKVNLKVSKDRIVSLEMTTALDATVAQVNTTLHEVTLRTASGQALTFKAPGAKVELQNKANGELADLKVGDSVRASLIFTQDMISSIAVKSSGMYKTLITNAATKQVTAKHTQSGVTVTFTLDSLDKIVNQAKPASGFEDIHVDEYIKASFTGTKLDQVAIMNTVRGKVNAVDATQQTITVQDFQGGLHVLALAQSFTVKLPDGTSSANITAIKAGDRVEIVKEADGKTLIHTAAASKRLFASYDNVLGFILLKPSGSNSKDRYNMHTKAYLHRGSTVVSPGSFAPDEEVNVYVIDDKIIEIEKP